MNSLTLNGKTYEVPSTWAELSPQQVAELASLLYANLPATYLQVEILLVLLNLRKRFWLKWTFFFKVKAEHLAQMLALTHWVNSAYDHTANRFPKLKKLFGPSDSLSNINFIEWIKAEQFYRAWWETKENEYLQGLTTVLYRPRKTATQIAKADYNGDPRIAYNDATFSLRLAKCKRIPFKYHLAVLMFYSACRKNIIDTYPTIFKASGETDPQNDPYIPLLREMAGSPRQEDLESYAHARLHDVLADWELKIEKANQIKNK
jgi:hypothetical protein